MKKYETLTTADIMRLSLIHNQWPDVWSDIEDVVSHMHHNARLTDFPYEDHESEIFWNWLGNYADFELEYLEEDIKEHYGHRLKFYPCGRSSATIYPDPWCKAHHSFQGLNNNQFYFEDYYADDLSEFLEDADQCNYQMDADGYLDCFKQDKEKLEVLQYIQRVIKNGIAFIPTAWKEYKETHPEHFEQEDSDDEY